MFLVSRFVLFNFRPGQGYIGGLVLAELPNLIRLIVNGDDHIFFGHICWTPADSLRFRTPENQYGVQSAEGE